MQQQPGEKKQNSLLWTGWWEGGRVGWRVGGGGKGVFLFHTDGEESAALVCFWRGGRGGREGGLCCVLDQGATLRSFSRLAPEREWRSAI